MLKNKNNFVLREIMLKNKNNFVLREIMLKNKNNFVLREIMLKNKNNFETINSFFIVRPRTFQSTLVREYYNTTI